ncbi:MAG: T9SS type A sorting domain-containing protein [Bacteroidetes bacterium]|nr:T9SS type A sorting domain-containing protein [Bacteroidota bacterium]
MLLLTGFYCFGQGNYGFTSSSLPYSDLSGSTSLNNNISWDDPTYLIPIGFTFDYFDQSFTSIYISDYVWFDVSRRYFIDVFTADLIDRNATTSVSPISYLLENPSGDSSILKIEWKNAGFYDESITGTTNDFINVQLWLYEGSNDIEIRIGPNSVLNEDSYGDDEGPHIGLTNETDTLDEVYLIGSPSALSVISSDGYISGTPSGNTVYKFEKGPVGINNNGPINSLFNIYPNPASERITIYYNNINNEVTDIKIFNLVGDLVHQTTQAPNFNNTILDLSHFSPGSYYVKISNSSTVLTKTFLVVD